MENIIYHPFNGEKVHIDSLKSHEIRSPNRLYKPEVWHAFRCENEPEDSRLFGLEFEFNVIQTHKPIDFDTIGKKLLLILNKHGQHCHILEDHSVRNGLEVIFQPMSLKYIHSKIDMEAFFENINILGLTTTHDTGFHIHINMKPPLHIRNLMLRLFTISYPLWLKLSKRKITRLQNRYISTEFFMMNDKIRERHKKNCEKIAENATSHVSFLGLHFDNYDIRNRYNAINFYNPITTEFRLFGGTKNYNQFLDIINFVERFIYLIDETINTRVDTVYTLDEFVERTNSQELLNKVTHELKKAALLLQQNKLYYNHFYLLDTYWYKSIIKHLKDHDYLISNHDYKDYLEYIETLNQTQDIYAINTIKEEINDFLLGKAYEVTKVTHSHVHFLPVVHSSFEHILEKEEIEKRYTILKCVNRDLILHLIEN